MIKINKYGIVPVGILEHLYKISGHYDKDYSSLGIDKGFEFVESKYEDIRHLFAVDLIQSK